MNTKKRTYLLSAGILSLTSVGMLTGVMAKKKTGNPSPAVPTVSVAEADGIIITNKSTTYNAAQRTSTVKLTFKVTPETADDYTLVDNLDWSNNLSLEWESESWGKDEDPSSYVSHTLNTANKEVTLTCLRPFGRSLNYTITCVENTAVKASINIDYVREETSKATANFTNTAFEEGKSITYSLTDAVYTIGSKGSKPTPTVEVKVNPLTDSVWNSLFPEIDLSGCSDTGNLSYDNGNGYTTMKYTQAQEYMKSRAKDYLINVATSKGSINFSRARLIEILTYKKKPNQYVNEITYTVVGETFIKNYKNLCSTYESGGLFADLYVNGEKVQSSKLTMNVKASEISNLTISQSQIDF